MQSHVLSKAAFAAHNAILKPVRSVQRYSNFPVHESEFWESLFKQAKDARTAQDVLEAMTVIESEPCIDNDRVWNAVRAVKATARLTLMSDTSMLRQH